MSYFSIAFIYFLLWCIACFYLLRIPFLSMHKALATLKQEKGWFVGEQRIVLNDTDTSSNTPTIYTDDDEYWKNGFTYYNPNDRAIWVSKRLGIGTTINMATKAGKRIYYGILSFLTISFVIFGLFLLQLDLTAPQLSIDEAGTTRIQSPHYNFSLSLADIEVLTLEETVPGGTKTDGLATSRYARGIYKLNQYGWTRLYIFKKSPPYIVIKLKDIYVIYNEKDPLDTKRIFEELSAHRREH